MATFRADTTEIEEFAKKLTQAGKNAERSINSVLHDKATSDYIKSNIQPLLPESHRTWAGKAPSAKSTQPFTQNTKYNLEVTVKNKTKYQYLYFSDDGSNTVNHMGNLNFMGRGLDASADTIIDRCLTKMTEDFNN